MAINMEDGNAIGIDQNEAKNFVSKIETIASEAKTKLNDTTNVDQVLADNWSGQGYTDFCKQFKEDIEKATEKITNLTKTLVEDLGKVSSDFTAFDQGLKDSYTNN